jgi:hypothetical protein
MADGIVRPTISSRRGGIYFVPHGIYLLDVRIIVEHPWRRASSVLGFFLKNHTAGGLVRFGLGESAPRENHRKLPIGRIPGPEKTDLFFFSSKNFPEENPGGIVQEIFLAPNSQMKITGIQKNQFPWGN